MIHRSRRAVSDRRGHAGLAGLVGAHRCRNAHLISLPGRHPCGRSPIGRGCRFRTGVMQVRVLPSVPVGSTAGGCGRPTPARRTKHPSRTRSAARMACQSSSHADPANARDRPVPRQLPDVVTVHRPTRRGADGSTPVSGTGGRRLKSCRLDNHAAWPNGKAPVCKTGSPRFESGCRIHAPFDYRKVTGFSSREARVRIPHGAHRGVWSSWQLVSFIRSRSRIRVPPPPPNPT
jgi:hypothetical protein